MGLPWVQGHIVGKMKDGKITCEVISRKQMLGDRPKSLEESGANRKVYERLNARTEDFSFETLGFMGGAVAWVLPTKSLYLFPNEKIKERFLKLYRGTSEELAWAEFILALLIRNTPAPTTWNCGEPAGGMPEDPAIPWILEMIDEGCETGIHSKDGWLGFRYPKEYAQYQQELDRRQAEWWSIVDPKLNRVGWADVKLLDIGQDTLDGEKGIICPCYLAGEFSFIKVATLDLPENNWKLRDLECRKTPNGWIPLNRKVCGIVPRENMSPMLFKFDREGGFDQFDLHFPLSGEVVSYVLSHLSIPLLGKRGLNWLKEEN
jgi:hypothetical protein